MEQNPYRRTHILIGFITLIVIVQPLSSRRSLVTPYVPHVLAPIDTIPELNLLKVHKKELDTLDNPSNHSNSQLQVAKADTPNSIKNSTQQKSDDKKNDQPYNSSLKGKEPLDMPHNSAVKPHKDALQDKQASAEDKKEDTQPTGVHTSEQKEGKKDTEVDNSVDTEDSSANKAENQEVGHLATIQAILCYIGFKNYCTYDATTDTELKEKTEEDITANIEPVTSKNCFEYGQPGAISSDWNNPEEHGWIVVNDMGSNKFTTKKPVNNESVQNLLLNELQCNSSGYEVGSDSIGGIVLRAMTDDEISVMLNTSTKTVALSRKNNNEYTELLEKPNNNINSDFLHKLSVIDSGYKGRIDVVLDGTPIMKVDDLFFKTSGGFGLRVQKGNVFFSDVTVEPLN